MTNHDMPGTANPNARGHGRDHRTARPAVKRRAFVLANRLLNAAVCALSMRRFRGAELLFLTTTGRKSGRQQTTPVLYLAEPHRWVVVASNGGANWEPGWWLNLRAGMPATIRVGGKVTPVAGAEITGTERDRMWKTLNEQVFNYEAYQAKVSRTIAVVALTPANTEPGRSSSSR
jgi:F420H(2)-dependent quinone reductase